VSLHTFIRTFSLTQRGWFVLLIYGVADGREKNIYKKKKKGKKKKKKKKTNTGTEFPISSGVGAESFFSVM
jgi:hypothetical protein